MTKSERLMFLVNMIRNRGTVLVREMAEECEVSHRTIYRDINSLMRLNFPLYYQNGYRLAQDIGFPDVKPNPEEVDLICYSLRNNPLSVHPFFKRRFRVIEQKIRIRLSKRQRTDLTGLFIFEKRQDVIEKSRESDILAQFLKAIHARRKIALTLIESDVDADTYIPLAIKLRQNEPFLLFATEEKLIIEEPIRNVESLQLTEEKFTQRPPHLLRRDLASQKMVDDM